MTIKTFLQLSVVLPLFLIASDPSKKLRTLDYTLTRYQAGSNHLLLELTTYGEKNGKKAVVPLSGVYGRLNIEKEEKKVGNMRVISYKFEMYEPISGSNTNVRIKCVDMMRGEILIDEYFEYYDPSYVDMGYMPSWIIGTWEIPKTDSYWEAFDLTDRNLVEAAEILLEISPSPSSNPRMKLLGKWHNSDNYMSFGPEYLAVSLEGEYVRFTHDLEKEIIYTPDGNKMIKKSIRAEKIKALKGSADRWHKYPNCKDYNEVASGNMRIIFHSDGTYEMYISDPGSLFPVNQIYRLGEWYIVRENTITVITHSAQTGIPGYTIPPQTFTFDSDGNVSYENNFYELCD